MDVLPTPDGRSLLVVDWGFLALRDPASLKVQRYLLPGVDGWTQAAFSADGRTLTAQTFDGQRYAFDTTTWKAERLVDARVGKTERQQAEFLLVDFRAEQTPDDFIQRVLQPVLDLPNASALIDKMGQEQFALASLALDDARQQLLVAELTGTLTLLEVDSLRTLRRVPCESCAVYLSLASRPGGFLGVTQNGRLHVLNRELKVERDFELFAPRLAPRPHSREEQQDSPRRIQRLLVLAEGSRLVWLTRDHDLGMFDLKTGQHVVRLDPVGRSGARMAALLDTRRLALLSDGTLRIWDMPEQRLLLEKQGPSPSAARLDAQRIVVSRRDGFAEVLSTDSGEVSQRF